MQQVITGVMAQCVLMVNQTEWEDNMAKITVPLLPHATPEYDQSQMAQLIQTLEQLIFALNNTYTSEPLRNDDEAVSWFLG